MVGETISHYRIIEELGRGGMGVVYRAEDLRLERVVALKFLSPHATGTEKERGRFLREARTAAALDHPSICTIHEIDEIEGRIFIAMALVEGESLVDVIERGPMRIDEAVDVAIQVAEGLVAAHEKGIVHRDIKPGNVMVTTGGRVRIMDFGLARFAGGTTLTSPDATVGTVPYMSPEQATGGDLDGRTDVWSLGTTLYEMITGLRAFRGDSDPAIVFSIVKQEPEPITGLRTGVPVELERIVNKAMAKELDERYQNVVDMLVDLRALRKRLGLVSATSAALTRYTTPGLVRPKHGGRWWLVAAACAVGVAVSAVAIVKLKGTTARVTQDRVAVVVFENRTGDAALGNLGQIAADRITEGLSRTGVVEVAPAVTAGELARVAGNQHVSAREPDVLRAVARQARVGTVVTGAYYLDGDDTRFQAEATDVEEGRVIYALAPLTGHREDSLETIEAVTQHVMGLLATDFDPILDSRPPVYDAHREFIVGMELWGADYAQAAEHFRNACDLDPDHFLAWVWSAACWYVYEEYAKADSVLGDLDSRRESLTSFERLTLDWASAFIRHDYSEALRLLRRADEILDERESDKHLHRMTVKRYLGRSAMLVNRPEQALAALEEHRELHRRYRSEMLGGGTVWEAWGFELECNALHMLGNYERELHVARIAREQFPDWPSVRVSETNALAALGRVDELIETVEECLGATAEPGRTGRHLVTRASAALRAHGQHDASVSLADRGAELYLSRKTPSQMTQEDLRAVGVLLYHAERWGEAQELFELLARVRPADLDAIGYLGTLAARRGDHEGAREVLEELGELESPYLRGHNTYWQASIAAVLGEKDRAVELLQTSLSEGAGLYHALWLHHDVDFEPLRDHAPFRELLRPKG